MKPKPLAPLTCRGCDASPADRGDVVPPTARGYTCSRCLCATPSEGGRCTPTGSADNAPKRLEKLTSSNTVSRRVATGRAFRPGRPPVSDKQKRQKARERDRAYRERRRKERLQAAEAARVAAFTETEERRHA